MLVKAILINEVKIQAKRLLYTHQEEKKITHMQKLIVTQELSDWNCQACCGKVKFKVTLENDMVLSTQAHTMNH